MADPASQGFGAIDAVVFEADFGLVEHDQFAVTHGVMEFSRDFSLVNGLNLHFLGKVYHVASFDDSCSLHSDGAIVQGVTDNHVVFDMVYANACLQANIQRLWSLACSQFANGKLVDKPEHIDADDILIDGTSSDDIGDMVLKDRELLSKNGIVIVSATISKKTKKIIASPQILTRGFIYVKDNLDIVEKSEAISKAVIEECIDGKKVDFSGIKNKIRERLGNYFNEETGSIPMIITVILEI